MRKFLFALVAVFIVTGVPTLASAKIKPHNLGSGLDVITYTVPFIVPTGDNVGVDGILVHHNYGSVEFAWTSSIGAMPYPAKLYAAVQDDTADSTPICAVTIVGKNQFGRVVSETISAINEHTERLTTNVYESVSSFSGSCSGYENANDDIRLRMSGFVGLPIDIVKVDQILSVVHRNATSVWAHSGAATDVAPSTAGGRFDNAGASSRVNLRYNWLDLETAGAMVEPGHDDIVNIRLSTKSGR